MRPFAKKRLIAHIKDFFFKKVWPFTTLHVSKIANVITRTTLMKALLTHIACTVHVTLCCMYQLLFNGNFMITCFPYLGTELSTFLVCDVIQSWETTLVQLKSCSTASLPIDGLRKPGCVLSLFLQLFMMNFKRPTIIINVPHNPQSVFY